MEAFGSFNPLSLEINHVDVKLGGNIYNPTYGIEIVTFENTYESNFMQGFGSVAIYQKIVNGMVKIYYLLWFYNFNDLITHQLFQP